VTLAGISPIGDRLADLLLSAQPIPLRAERFHLQREVSELIQRIYALLFPGTLSGSWEDDRPGLIQAVSIIERQLSHVLHAVCCPQTTEHCPITGMCRRLTERLLDELPDIRSTLLIDASTAHTSDPAADGLEEIVLAYPGFYAIAVYRIANRLHRYGVELIPRMMTEEAHWRTGIDIHPGARIGRGCFIDHGTGVVIGETTVIGDTVKIYQGVTLGALSVAKRAERWHEEQRHPTIEDEVTIYAGATILGGNTIVGRGSVIGGNVWLTNSVPPHSKVIATPSIACSTRKTAP